MFISEIRYTWLYFDGFRILKDFYSVFWSYGLENVSDISISVISDFSCSYFHWPIRMPTYRQTWLLYSLSIFRSDDLVKCKNAIKSKHSVPGRTQMKIFGVSHEMTKRQLTLSVRVESVPYRMKHFHDRNSSFLKKLRIRVEGNFRWEKSVCTRYKYTVRSKMKMRNRIGWKVSMTVSWTEFCYELFTWLPFRNF